MREWNFANGIIVKEKDFDRTLHCFDVYNGEEYLGNITPDSIETMEDCIKSLDAGEDPIGYHWEDGMGNSCELNGWGENAKRRCS